MSALSEQVKIALYAKLNVSSVTDLASGGVHSPNPPAESDLPYVVFERQAPGAVNYAFNYTNILEDDLWMIKAITDPDSSQTLSPRALGEDILEQCRTAIGNALTISGGTVHWVARFADIPPFTEDLSDRKLYHQGFLLRVGSE